MRATARASSWCSRRHGGGPPDGGVRASPLGARDTAREMSQENVEVVRKGIDAFNAFMRGEFALPVVEREILDQQFEFHWHDERTYPDVPQHLRGVPELIEFWEQLRSAWVDLAWEPLELIEAPDDRVVTPTRLSGRGLRSGGSIEVHFFLVWTIRDGRVRRMEVFRHRAEGLEAAGLRE